MSLMKKFSTVLYILLVIFSFTFIGIISIEPTYAVEFEEVPELPNDCKEGFVGPLTPSRQTTCTRLRQEREAIIQRNEAQRTSNSEECQTSILTGVSCDGSGSGINDLLQIVLDILTIGVGIAAVVGFTIAAILYLTASGKEDQVKRAKTMMFNIVIGLAVYATMWTILTFLVPSFGSSSEEGSLNENPNYIAKIQYDNSLTNCNVAQSSGYERNN